MEINHKFTGVWIPKEIWLNESLAPLEKLLWAELYSLDGDDGCYAGNEYLAKILDCSPRRIQQMLSKLRDMYLIKIEIKNQNQRIIRMAIQFVGTKNISSPHEINFIPPMKNISPPPTKYISPIDTSIIDTNINTNEEVTKRDFEIVWKLYGRIGNKVSSYKSFIRLSKKDQDSAAAHVPIYISHHIDANKKAFIPHFSTYLNQRRWEDQLPYQLDKKQDDKWSQFGQTFL
jgi:hypothetical protein